MRSPLHKKFRRCAFCGRPFIATIASQRPEKRDNSYCLNLLCQEEKEEERLRRLDAAQAKYRKAHPGIKNEKPPDDFEVFCEKNCSCGKRIEKIIAWPFSKFAPSEPARCIGCREINANGVSLEDIMGYRVDGDYKFAY